MVSSSLTIMIRESSPQLQISNEAYVGDGAAARRISSAEMKRRREVFPRVAADLGGTSASATHKCRRRGKRQHRGRKAAYSIRGAQSSSEQQGLGIRREENQPGAERRG